MLAHKLDTYYPGPSKQRYQRYGRQAKHQMLMRRVAYLYRSDVSSQNLLQRLPLFGASRTTLQLLFAPRCRDNRRTTMQSTQQHNTPIDRARWETSVLAVESP